MNDSARWNTILDIVTVCRRMWQKGWVANHDGNVTARIGDELIATPAAASKNDISPEIILTLDMDGKKIAGPGKPFSEISLHLAAYRANPNTVAVVHAHPPYATARGACGLALDKPFIPETVVSLGHVIPVTPYAMPGSTEGTNLVAEMFRLSNAFMIAGNGVLAVGSDVMQAYLRLELVEHLAKMDFIANHLGKPFEIPRGDIEKLLVKRATAGLAPQAGGSAESKTSGYEPPVTDHDKLRQIIAEEIKLVLKK